MPPHQAERGQRPFRHVSSLPITAVASCFKISAIRLKTVNFHAIVKHPPRWQRPPRNPTFTLYRSIKLKEESNSMANSMSGISGKESSNSHRWLEQVELTEPEKALENAGVTVHIVSLKSGEIKGWKSKEWGDKVKVDKTLDQAKPRLRRPPAPRRRHQPRPPPHRAQSRPVRKEFRSVRQARGRHLPRPLDAHRSRSGKGQKDDFLALRQDRPEKCRSQLGGRSCRCRRKPDHKPQTRRSRNLQQTLMHQISQGSGQREQQLKAAS